ncbi:MAG: RNA 2',3'-cyclic phosphodiesterase [Deltaproteobacteria bacterium]|nr:RNA 2',3'-cyclic phosphodiesterase [Deltaproteobacteria bacterium]
MNKFIRAFIAIEPEIHAKDQIITFIEKIKKVIKGDINWTKKENLHFTIKFLGEIPQDKIEDIKRLLYVVSTEHSPFLIKVAGIGFFPDNKRPRIIWLGLRDGREELIDIVNSIENKVESIGFSRERREFKAHLTVARIKSNNIKIEMGTLNELLHKDICDFFADRIILYKSDLLPSGAKYTALGEYGLCHK